MSLAWCSAACSPLTLYCRRTGYCWKMKRHMNCLPSSRGRWRLAASGERLKRSPLSERSGELFGDCTAGCFELLVNRALLRKLRGQGTFRFRRIHAAGHNRQSGISTLRDFRDGAHDLAGQRLLIKSALASNDESWLVGRLCIGKQTAKTTHICHVVRAGL